MILEFKLQTKFFCSIFWSISKWNYYKEKATDQGVKSSSMFYFTSPSLLSLLIYLHISKGH